MYTTALLDIDFPIYNPIDNINYLIGRITDSAEGYYKDFQESEERMSNQEIHRMSVLSDKILSSLDYVSIIERRRFNYHLLYSALTAFNKFDFSISENQKCPVDISFLYEQSWASPTINIRARICTSILAKRSE